MRKIKATALVITLALAGVAYAAGNIQEAKQSPVKDQAAACCAEAEKCCNHSEGAEKCCKKDKEGAACCAAMTKDAKAGAETAACSCCDAHAKGGEHAANHSSQACPTDGAGCCANCGDCCKDGACSKEKGARH